MFIQVNTTSSVQGSAELASQVEAVVEDTLGRFEDRITEIAVHLDDVNAHKGGDKDNRCTMEAHLKRIKTIAVTHHAPTLDLAVVGAAEKMKASIESTIGRRRDTARSPRIEPGEPSIVEPEGGMFAGEPEEGAFDEEQEEGTFAKEREEPTA